MCAELQQHVYLDVADHWLEDDPVELAREVLEGDTEILKALDFHNQLDESFLTFDLCWAKVGCEHCGIYMPSFYWLKKATGRWKFKCAIQWAVVEERMPKAYEQMVKNYGADKTIWPQPGCWANFIPWARGASKVIEFLADGQWYSFLASRLPDELDDEIKKVLFDASGVRPSDG